MITRDTSPGAFAVSVVCLHCGKMRRLSDMNIDTNGPSYRAYYCVKTNCYTESKKREFNEATDYEINSLMKDQGYDVPE